MQGRTVLRLLLLCGALLALFAALSQSEGGAEMPRTLYQSADSLYRRALWLATQRSYNEAEEERLNHAALQAFTTYFAATKRVQAAPDSTYFFASIKAGELAHYFEDLPLALKHYNAAVALRGRLTTLPDTAFFKPYILAALIYITQNRLDSAKASLQRAETILQRHERVLPESERLYNLFGSIHYEYGNYRQAKNYFEKAADVLAPTNPSYRGLLVNYRINLATALLKLEEYDAANRIYLDLLPRSQGLQNQINNNLGLIQLKLGAPRLAIAYFQKVAYASPLAIGLNNDLATAYFDLKKFDSSRHYLERAEAVYHQYSNGSLSLDYGRTLKLWGDFQHALGDDRAALALYQQSLHQFYPAFADTAITKNPAKFSGAFSYINLFQALVAKAEAQETLYTKTATIGWADQSLETYAAAFRLMEYVERSYESDEARLFLAATKQAVHNRPIDLAFALYKRTGDGRYLDALYTFDQQNKAAVLALNRQQNTAANAASPETERVQVIKNELTRLSIKAARLTTGVQADSLGRQIRGYEMELARLQANRQLTGAEESKVPTLASLQTELLDERTALLSYHLSPDKLTTLVVTKKALRCEQDVLPKGFLQAVETEIGAFKTAGSGASSQNNKTLSSLLLKHLPEDRTSQVILIPDDVLLYLPFESLRDEAGKFLVQKMAVQYHYSTALLGRTEGNFSSAHTLAVAPFAAAAGDGLPALPASAQEIAEADGKKLLNGSATKSAFLKQAGDYEILHLATHAVVQSNRNDLSYVVFAPEGKSGENLLHAQEIYNLRLPKTKLVILSACETGSGELVRGEGILSLSRAFAYAGCPNVITSLWKADDVSTAYLVKKIHEYLADKRPIAEAVQKAKQDYLADKAVNPRLKHPFYWAHLVFVGDYAPPKGKTRIWWLLALVVVLTAAAGSSRRAKGSSQ